MKWSRHKTTHYNLHDTKVQDTKVHHIIHIHIPASGLDEEAADDVTGAGKARLKSAPKDDDGIEDIVDIIDEAYDGATTTQNTRASTNEGIRHTRTH